MTLDDFVRFQMLLGCSKGLEMRHRSELTRSCPIAWHAHNELYRVCCRCCCSTRATLHAAGIRFPIGIRPLLLEPSVLQCNPNVFRLPDPNVRAIAQIRSHAFAEFCQHTHIVCQLMLVHVWHGHTTHTHTILPGSQSRSP